MASRRSEKFRREAVRLVLTSGLTRTPIAAGVGYLLATNGWKIEGKKAIVGHGGCGKSVVRAEGRLNNNFLDDFNELRHTRQPKSGSV